MPSELYLRSLSLQLPALLVSSAKATAAHRVLQHPAQRKSLSGDVWNSGAGG